MPDSEPRVVITGMSVISPLGTELDSFWSAIAAGDSGVRRLQSQECEDLAVAIGGQATEFTGHIDNFGQLPKDLKKSIRKALKLMCREIQMGVAAAQKALSDAKLSPGDYSAENFGVVFGCDHIVTTPDEFTDGIRTCVNDAGRFEYQRWATDGMPKVSPLWLLKYLPNMPASHIAILNQLHGPNNSLTYREAAGSLAVDEAFRTIRRGAAKQMIAGATGCNISPIKSFFVASQSQLAIASDTPAEACRPFDRDRTGLVPGEGAASFILEERETAIERGARIYAEILSAGSAIAADRDGVAKPQISMQNAMKSAIRNGAIDPSSVGHINAHGLATTHSDICESRAIKHIFGDATSQLPVVAPKSNHGNLGAASGLVELAASILGVRAGHLFPTLNYKSPDPDCPIHIVTSCRPIENSRILALSATPQGQSSALLLEANTEDS